MPTLTPSGNSRHFTSKPGTWRWRTSRQPSEFWPYRILPCIGSGGMGTVFLAERDYDDVRRQVAIKIIRRALLDREIVRRFLQERQILARLEHPNIARMLDAGRTPDGMPYLVMEFVDGIPIDRK